jgi:trehalose 6-phosphate phosphatase
VSKEQDVRDPVARPCPPDRFDFSGYAAFLDFDGVLAPIVEHPEDVVMDEITTDLVRRLREACGGAVAIVTGRSLESVLPYLNDLEIIVSGSHGHELHMPGSEDAGRSGRPKNSVHHSIYSRTSRNGMI